MPAPLGAVNVIAKGPMRGGVDVFTHFLVPFAAALVALGLWRVAPEDPGKQIAWRHKLALAVVVGFAGAAPDADSVYHWLRHVEGLYWLQHRGVSHSLIGAPLHGIAAAGLIALVGRLFPKRLGWLRWRAAYVPAGAIGGLSHVALDLFTYAGVPLLWPIDHARVSLNVYSWLVVWMAIPAGLISVLFLVGKLPPRRVVQLTALLVAAMLVYGGARLGERPDLAPGEQAYPRASYREWIVLTPDGDGGWWVQIHHAGEPVEPQWHNASHVEPGSEAAVERVKDTNAYRGFRMSTFGPIVTTTTALDDGGWEVGFTALVPRKDAVNDPRYTPTIPFRDWGLLVVHVVDDEVETVRHGW